MILIVMVEGVDMASVTATTIDIERNAITVNVDGCILGHIKMGLKDDNLDDIVRTAVMVLVCLVTTATVITINTIS